MKSNQPTIALAMIIKDSKDELDLLDQCLASVSGYVDKVFIDFNGADTPHPISKQAQTLSKKYAIDAVGSTWTGNFVDARNKNFARVPKEYDFILWLDADDTIDKPEEIRKNIAVLGKQQQAIYAKYEYDHDEFGNPTVSHYVARIVRNNGGYAWKSSIADNGVSVHETLNEVVARPKAITEDFAVIHHADPLRRQQSLQRNIKLLEGMYDKQVENGTLDPRTLFYLATHYYDAYRYDAAKPLLEEYLQLSGWAEERCEALVYLGKIYEAQGKPGQARHSYLLAIGEYQNSPRPYIELSKIDYQKQRYQDSADWIEKCLKLPKPTTTMVQRPMESTYDAYMLAAQAYVNLGGTRLDEAKEYVTKALKLRPLSPDAQNARDLIDKLLDQREDIRAAMRLVNRFKENKETDKILQLLDSLPYEVQDNPLILTTRHDCARPVQWGERDIAIYVGQGPLGIWGPWSLNDGIGGSEEAVIQLSRQLAYLGWKVHIYGTPGNRAGLDDMVPEDTVYWHQYYELNPKDKFNILISWRNPGFFDFDITAKKKYLWLHDVMDKEEFTPTRLANIDKVIFVGEYHASLYEEIIPEEKWFISGNGIDPEQFEKADALKLKRQPHRLIYMSAYNRGLKILLDHWDEIKKEVPDATLDIYYGWESYDAINRDNPERMDWKDKLVAQMKRLDGVTDHGRISHAQIAEEIAKADIFAYPCIFPEVYCISYAKALSGGAHPVTSDYAELGNYFGTHVHYEPGQLDSFVNEYITTLVKELKADKKKLDTSFFREKYAWSKTAQGWDEEFRG